VELSDEFTVSLPIDHAFSVLTDVRRIAPCMPGAELQEVDGDEYRGVVKVKVGPITAQYKGVAHFVSLDAGEHRAVLRAEGRDTRGQGNASATISATLEPVGDRTKVRVLTNLTVTGRVAQFGRGVLADVSSKLLGQFVDCLEATIAGEAAEPPPVAGDGAGATRPAPADQRDQPATASERPAEASPTKPVDLIELAGSSVLRRVAPLAGAVAAVLAAVWAARRLLRRRAD